MTELERDFREACIELYLELRDKDKETLTDKEVDFMYQLVRQPWSQFVLDYRRFVWKNKIS